MSNRDTGNIVSGSRVCRVCLVSKNIQEYHYANNKKHRRRICKTCMHEQQLVRLNKRRESDPVAYNILRKNGDYGRKYGLTYDEVINILLSQDNKCLICVQIIDESTLNIDHDHKTGKVRGLLCKPCNLGIGLLKDSIENIERALVYLQGEKESD